MKFTLKHLVALIGFTLAAALMIHAITAFFTPDPVTITKTLPGSDSSDDHHLTFAASANTIGGRCTVVRWDVSTNQGLWINGYPRESAGSVEVCIGDFTRPQLYVIFDDTTVYLQELAIESLIYTPNVALNLALHISLIILLLAFSTHLTGFTLPHPIRAAVTAPLRTLDHANRLPAHTVIAVLLLIFVSYAALHIPLFGDLPLDAAVEEDYLTDLSLREVWQTGLRPITIPAFFQLFGNNGSHIEVFQWIFSPVAWGIFAAALAFVLVNPALKIAGFTIILLFSLTRDVVYWHSTLYSESLSNSLFAILMAAALITLWLYRHHAPRLTIRAQLALSLGLFVLTVLWSFTRDDNSYAVAGTGGVLLLVAAIGFYMYRWNLLLVPLVLGLTFPIMFLVQSHNADVGVRHRLPLVNVLAKRILIDPDKTAFFAERGMPTNDKVMMYAGVDKFAWSHGLDFSGFEGWIESDGKRVYTEYLLSRPWESFWEPFDHWDQLWLYDDDLISEWASPITIPAWQDAITDVIYGELWGLLILSSVGLLTALLVTVYTGLDYRYSVPIMFLLLTIPAAFLNWHADSFAIGRHSLMLAIRWRLAMWLFVLFGLDRMIIFSPARLDHVPPGRGSHPLPHQERPPDSAPRLARPALPRILAESRHDQPTHAEPDPAAAGSDRDHPRHHPTRGAVRVSPRREYPVHHLGYTADWPR